MRAISSFLLLTSVLTFPALAADTPKTVELPTALIQRVMQVLALEEGATSSSVIRAINDCVVSQFGQRDKTQPDRCPDVTAAMAERDALKASAPK